MNEQHKIINNIINEALGVEKNITPELNLEDDLGFDSLDLIDVSIEVEAKFNIAIADAELKDIKTVQGIYNLVERKTNTH